MSYSAHHNYLVAYLTDMKLNLSSCQREYKSRHQTTETAGVSQARFPLSDWVCNHPIRIILAYSMMPLFGLHFLPIEQILFILVICAVSSAFYVSSVNACLKRAKTNALSWWHLAPLATHTIFIAWTAIVIIFTSGNTLFV